MTNGTRSRIALTQPRTGPSGTLTVMRTTATSQTGHHRIMSAGVVPPNVEGRTIGGHAETSTPITGHTPRREAGRTRSTTSSGEAATTRASLLPPVLPVTTDLRHRPLLRHLVAGEPSLL